MNVEIEELSPCRRKLNIEVPAETISSEYDDALKVYSRQVSLPGFRPGKAPKQLVKSRYHKEIIGRLRDHLLPKSYHEALQEKALNVLNIIDMDEDIQVKEGEPLAYSVTVDVQPEVSLPEYKTLSLEKSTEDVTDAEVDERIESLREQRADYEEVEDRPVARGDMAQIDFTGTLDGRPLEEAEPEAKGLGEAMDFWLQASDEAFIPELGLGLPGMAIGDERDIDVTFQDDFVVENLRGQAVKYHVKVKAVRARKLPELNKEFFDALGVESEDAFRGQIVDSLKAEKDRDAEGKLRRDIETFLLDNTRFDLPESMVEEASRQHVRRIADDLQRGGQDENQVLEKKDEIMETAKSAAERQVKLRLILYKVAAEEGLQVTDNEVNREISMLAYAYSMERDELEKRLRQQNQLDDLRGDILCRKAMQTIQDAADISGEDES